MSQDFSFSVPTPFAGASPGPKAEASLPPAKPADTSAAKPVVEEIYGKLPFIPVMDAAEGIRFDFNEGLRVKFPNYGGPWHIVFRDLDTGVILYAQDVGPDTYVTSVKKFYVRFQLEIFHKEALEDFKAAVKKNPYLAADPDKQPKPFFRHDYDARDKTVMIQLPVSTIGDTLGWFPYVENSAPSINATCWPLSCRISRSCSGSSIRTSPSSPGKTCPSASPTPVIIWGFFSGGTWITSPAIFAT